MHEVHEILQVLQNMEKYLRIQEELQSLRIEQQIEVTDII